MNKLLPSQIEAVYCLFEKGISSRCIAKKTGHSKRTILRYWHKFNKQMRCDLCSRPLNKKKEFHRRTSRTYHKFCSHWCFTAWTKLKNNADICKRCGISREFLRINETAIEFCQGLCSRCYILLSTYGFDPALAHMHELQKELKEIANGKHQEHLRTSLHATSDNSGRTTR